MHSKHGRKEVNFKGFGSNDNEQNDTISNSDVFEVGNVDETPPEELFQIINKRREKARIEMKYYLPSIAIRRDNIFEKLLDLFKDQSFCLYTFPFFTSDGEQGEYFDGLKLCSGRKRISNCLKEQAHIFPGQHQKFLRTC